MKLVVTGNYQQYREFLTDFIKQDEFRAAILQAQGKQLTGEFKYIRTVEDLHGYRDIDVIYHGEYWLSKVYNTPELLRIDPNPPKGKKYAKDFIDSFQVLGKNIFDAGITLGDFSESIKKMFDGDIE